MTVIIKKLNETSIQIKNYDAILLNKLRNFFVFNPPDYKFSPKYKSGMWDGKINLFNTRNDTLPIGLFKKAYKIIKSVTDDIICDLTLFDRGFDVTKEEIIQFSEIIKYDNVPYEHQVNTVIKCLKNKRLTIESATGSGKSFSIFLLCNFLKMKNEKEKILIIVPSIQLVKQMVDDFNNYSKNYCDFSSNVHQIYANQEKTTDKFITISTYQSLLNIDKEVLGSYSSLIVDECHIIFNNKDSLKAVVNIINSCSNCSNKYGFSGSLVNDFSHEIQLNAIFGDVERIVNASSLIKSGLLSDFCVKCIILDYHIDKRIELKNKIDSLKKTTRYETQKYLTEMNFIIKSKEKFDFMIKFCNKIEKNSIVLFKTIEYGNDIYNELFKNKNKRVYYIDGSVDVLKREEIRKNMEIYDNCILVGSIGTISTGINIKNVYNIVFVESIKSEIKVIQSIGRILRKIKNKKSTLYDISDDLAMRDWTNYSMRHQRARLSTYKKENHDVKIIRFKI